MARINIEDTIYRDARFQKLLIKLGSLDTAIGALVRAWSLAQEWYLTPERMIPVSAWREQEINDAILEVGLAIQVDQKIHMKGADDQFAWLLQRSQCGKRGGPAAAKARLENIEESKRRDSSELVGSASDDDGSCPLTLTLKEKNNTCSSDDERHRFDLDQIYQQYPRKIGKKLGMKKLARVVKTQEDYERVLKAVQNYAQDCWARKTEIEYVKHFSTFMGCWEDWVNPDPSSSPTSPEPKKLKTLEELEREEELNATW